MRALRRCRRCLRNFCISPSRELSYLSFAQFLALPPRPPRRPPALLMCWPIAPATSMAFLRTLHTAMSGRTLISSPTICMTVLSASVAPALTIDPAKIPPPNSNPTIGKTMSSPTKVERHLLKNFSVFGSKKATKASGEITIRMTMRALRAINRAAIVTITTSPETSAPIRTARARTAAVAPARTVNAMPPQVSPPCPDFRTLLAALIPSPIPPRPARRP